MRRVNQLSRGFLAILLACGLLLSGCAERYGSGSRESQPGSSGSSAAESSQAPPALPTEDRIDRVRLLAVGDNLIHDAIYMQAGERAGGGGYDFRPVYERLREQISSADLAFINQETPMAKSFAPSTYPMFNTPVQMADNLREIGFDVLNIANNHMIDKGAEGLAETIELIRSTPGLTMAGAYPTAEDYRRPPVVERNGIRFAFIGATQHTNGLRLPDELSERIVYTDELDALERLVERAREQADVVVASVHWGDEGTTNVNLSQRGIAQHLADFGVNIIIGTHPHVLQPAEVLTGENGGQTIVLYSLGNFVSAQSAPYNLVGAIAELNVEKNRTTRKVTISAPEFTPVITHYEAGFQNLSLYPLSEYTDELAARHGVSAKSGKRFDLAYIQALLEEVCGAVQAGAPADGGLPPSEEQSGNGAAASGPESGAA